MVREACLASGFLLLLAVAATYGREVMTNSWFVRLNGDHGADVAKDVAKRNGFSFVSPVSLRYDMNSMFRGLQYKSAMA